MLNDTVAPVCFFAFPNVFCFLQCTKAFKTAKVEKGVAFPTCISANECVGHYSPLKGESDAIKAGDVLKMCVLA
jgi:methionine aminopeptidase